MLKVSKQMYFESEILRCVSNSIVLLLSLYFLQLSKHVGPNVEDFAMESFQDFRPSCGDQDSKSHGVEFAVAGL